MKKAIRIGVVFIASVALILGYYYYLSTRSAKPSKSNYSTDEVLAICDKDMVNDYPGTPRQVVKWYNRIITAYYSEDFTEEEFGKMIDQARALLDDELLLYNERPSYMIALAAEIEDYHKRKRYIISSDVSDSADVTYATVNGYEVAYVKAYYFSKEGSNFDKTYEDYVLRKDSQGHWKILTWRLSTDADEFRK